MDWLARLFARGKGRASPPREGVLCVPRRPPQASLAQRRALTGALWRELGIYEQDRAELFTAPLLRLAAWVGELPASEDHHGSRAGGLLTHSLETALHALRALETSPRGLEAGGREDDPVQRELFRLPWQYATFVGALLHDLGKVFYLKVAGPGAAAWEPLKEDLWSYAAALRSADLLVEHIPGRGLFRHERFAAGFLFDLVGAAGRSLMGPEILAKLLQNAAGAHKQVAQEGPGAAQARALRAGDRESVRQDRARRPEPAESPPEASLAELVLRGLRLLIAQGEFTINGKGAEVYVGRAATAVVVPVTLRAAVECLRRLEPTNRRLRQLAPRNEAPIFAALAERDWLLTPPRRSVVMAKVHHPGPGHASNVPLSVLVFKNEVLWNDLKRPDEFAGRLLFSSPKDGAEIVIDAFHADPATGSKSESSRVLVDDRFPHLLDDLARAVTSKEIGCNKPGAQLYTIGDESVLVVPAAIKRAIAVSKHPYPQPIDLHMNAIYDALASAGAKTGSGGRVVQIVQIDGVRAPLNVVVLPTEILLNEEQRAALGAYAGGYQIAAQGAAA